MKTDQELQAIGRRLRQRSLEDPGFARSREFLDWVSSEEGVEFARFVQQCSYRIEDRLMDTLFKHELLHREAQKRIFGRELG
jgi:hypothetical protein